VEGRERIEVMQWFVKKGAKIEESKPILFNYYYDMSESDAIAQNGLDLVTLTVFTCDEDVEPAYPNPGKRWRDLGILLIEGPERANNCGTVKCRQLVKLTADLNRIPKTAMKREKGPDNMWYYKIRFQIAMTCHSAHISFDLLHRGTKYGSVEAEYM